MVVRCRTQQLLNSGKNLAFRKNLQLCNKRPSVFLHDDLHKRQLFHDSKPSVRLCVFRCYHSSREPRTTLGKLSPQEVASTCVSADFFNPQCTSFGESCLDCYTKKFCVGGAIWSNTSCEDTTFSGANIYCNPKSNQCTSTPPPECSVKRGLTCLRPNGVFPNINNCSRYIKCQDDAPTTFECPSKHVYNQTLGKCVFKLENSNCFQVSCGLLSTAYQYPGDASLYYQCTAGVPKLLACPENNVYNVATKTCENICKGPGYLANPKNCSEYISCQATGSSYTATTLTCRPGYGVNPIRGECQKGLDRLCFELATFNNSLNNLIFLPNFVKIIIVQVKDLLANFNIDYSILLKIGIPANVISAVLLIGDYFLTHRFMLPPLVLNSIIEIIVSLLPSNLRMVGNLIISIISGSGLF